MKPTVHLNGTSKLELKMAYENAANAVFYALDMLVKTAPHGRDYYPQGEQAIRDAVREHSLRAKKLREVLDELQTIEGGLV
jgi:hypothetical protein